MPTQLAALSHSIVTMMALINFGVRLQAVNSNMTPITSCRNVISITETHGLCVCCLSCFFVLVLQFTETRNFTLFSQKHIIEFPNFQRKSLFVSQCWVYQF